MAKKSSSSSLSSLDKQISQRQFFSSSFASITMFENFYLKISIYSYDFFKLVLI